MPKPTRSDDDLIDWFTISYKSIYIAVGVLLAIAAGFGYFFWHRAAPPVVEASPRPSGATAHFTSLEGNVKVKPVGIVEWMPADTQMALKKNDLVRTGSGAAAEITFFDGTVVHVRPDSLITIEETSEDPSTKQKKVAWHISSGEVNFQTVKRAGTTEISTPTVKTTAAESTQGGIRVAESGDSDVRIFAGALSGETKSGQRFSLANNEAQKVDTTGRAGPKIQLLAAPLLVSPAHQADVTYPDPTRATTLLAWKPVAGASGYHVMLDYSAYFNRPLVDRGGIKDSSVELRGLDVGKYYWRVAAVDATGTEGSYSDFARFSVTRPAGASTGGGPPPPLTVEPLEVRGMIVQVKGRTEAGASVTVNGQRVGVQGDGSFNEFITLEKVGRQDVVIRAAGLNGGTSELKRSVVVGD
jgi:hypothetical protein